MNALKATIVNDLKPENVNLNMASPHAPKGA
jgi:hypothetical protein